MKKLFILFLIFCSGSIVFGQSHLSKKDSGFVVKAEDHILLEIKLAQLAQTNASSAEVKDLSSTLLSYHTKVSGELKQLAGQKNITLSSQLSKKSQSHYDKLSKKQGADFDKAYTNVLFSRIKWGPAFLKKKQKKAKTPRSGPGRRLIILSWNSTLKRQKALASLLKIIKSKPEYKET